MAALHRRAQMQNTQTYLCTAVTLFCGEHIEIQNTVERIVKINMYWGAEGEYGWGRL